MHCTECIDCYGLRRVKVTGTVTLNVTTVIVVPDHEDAEVRCNDAMKLVEKEVDIEIRGNRLWVKDDPHTQTELECDEEINWYETEVVE